jgi:hypothetical protein
MSRLAEAIVKGMDENELYEALDLIESEIRRREEGGFAEVVNGWLRDGADAELTAAIRSGRDAVCLEFRAGEWEDGWFYNEHSGLLTLGDGSVEEVDFANTAVDEALTGLSGVARRDGGLGADSRLVVDLRTGAVTHI